MSTTLEKLKELIVDQLGVKPEEVTPEAKFTTDLGADSLDLAELIMSLEEEFEVDIPDTEAQKIETIQDAINFIEANKN